MLDLVCDAPCFNLVVVRNEHRINQERARQECLERLLIELNGQKIFSLTLDSRESIVGTDPQVRNKKDLATRRRLTTAGNISRNMRMTHCHDHQEQLLWVPDAVGWAHRRHLLLGDSELWLRVEGVTQVIDVG